MSDIFHRNRPTEPRDPIRELAELMATGARKPPAPTPARPDPARGVNAAPTPARTPAATQGFEEFWRKVTNEFKTAVGVYNMTVNAVLVSIQVGTGESISIRKPTFPAAYLDLMPYPDTGRCTVRFEFYRSHSSTPRIAEETVQCTAAGDDLALVLNGTAHSPAQFVARIMDQFLEGV